ncbi:hypothetical protein pqer_cds_218 [Pandoravirus quercus]|uniref:Uncharacterized protein n=1 Tax=Pandoravirus quercus TaxID=2107709 RepID=A0A2U7U889_9VIRU|nr:hypothetical protein pqer_cds_218 [Pandoravirus quercus]AVK74640.1 hypothetical protein pqer_cds_218 [Pandoravirus quercus]
MMSTDSKEGERRGATRRRLQERVATVAEIEQTSPEAIKTATDVIIRSGIRAGRRQSAVNPRDGGLYDWPVSLIDAAFIKRVTDGAPDDIIIVSTPPPSSLSAVLVVPTHWPFWADTDERRARWLAMVTAQRMAREVIPQRSLDRCSRCNHSIIDRRLQAYGPPDRYASGDAEWQKTARACDAARRMLDHMDAHPSMEDGLYEKMARDAQRLLMLIAKQTDGFCLPVCSPGV